MRSSTHCLSSVTASTYMFVESSDSWSSHSAIVAMANQPKICCAYDSAIEIAAFPTARVQHAKSLMPFALQSHTQHSSERNIGRHMLRATYGDDSAPSGAGGGRVLYHASARPGRHRPDTRIPRGKECARQRRAEPVVCDRLQSRAPAEHVSDLPRRSPAITRSRVGARPVPDRRATR